MLTRDPVTALCSRKQGEPESVCSCAAVAVVPLAVTLQELDVHDVIICMQQDTAISQCGAVVHPLVSYMSTYVSLGLLLGYPLHAIPAPVSHTPCNLQRLSGWI